MEAAVQRGQREQPDEEGEQNNGVDAARIPWSYPTGGFEGMIPPPRFASSAVRGRKRNVIVGNWTR